MLTYLKRFNGEIFKVIKYNLINRGYDVLAVGSDTPTFIPQDEVIQLSEVLYDLRDEFTMTFNEDDTPEIITPKDANGKPFKSKIQRLRIVLAQYQIEYGFKIQCATWIKSLTGGNSKLVPYTEPYEREGGFRFYGTHSIGESDS